MNMKKRLLILALVGATTLLAADLSTIDVLIEKINKTQALEAKEALVIQLNKEVEKLDRLDVIKAQEMIDSKLLLPKQK